MKIHLIASFLVLFPALTDLAQPKVSAPFEPPPPAPITVTGANLSPATSDTGRMLSVSADEMLANRHAAKMLVSGREIFRFDTFGDEDFWGGALTLHLAIAGANNGGVGPGLSPRAALGLGLKVDSRGIPPTLAAQIKAGQVNLDDPATTLALLQLNAVVGVTGFFTNGNRISSIGIQCALCHSTVDDSFLPGVGERLDGWPNRDLNVGAIIALAPNLSPFAELLGVNQATVRQVVTNWGPGKFDAELSLDGKGFKPDGTTAATLIPAAFGLAGVNLHTYTGWGSVSHWNAFVANIEMHGKGNFFDPRLDDAATFPVAARARLGHIQASPEEDLITSKLPALHFYQLAIPAPKPPPGSFNFEGSQRGKTVFEGKAKCASCHVPPLFTEPGWNMHTGAEIGIGNFQSNRSPDKRYRTTPLAGLFARQKGGFYHDGRFATLMEVVNHYNNFLNLGLTAEEKNDLVEYLKSI